MDSTTTETYTLSLHDALPILAKRRDAVVKRMWTGVKSLVTKNKVTWVQGRGTLEGPGRIRVQQARSEEHTSELQSRRDLVCRLLLEKKKQKTLLAHSH